MTVLRAAKGGAVYPIFFSDSASNFLSSPVREVSD